MVRKWIDSGEARTVNVAGPTWRDTLATMVRGTPVAPGLMGVWPAHQTPEIRMARDDPHLRCWNDAKVQLFAAQKADRFRGLAGDKGWLDEVDSWKPEGMPPRDAFMLMEQRIRTGPNPQIICTSTPKPTGLIRELRERDDCVVTRATMYDNAANLAPQYVRRMRARYEGTRMGDQELLGVLLTLIEGALVSHEMIDQQRITLAEFAGLEADRAVVGVDPYGGGGDMCGISGAARDGDDRGYVLADRTCKLGPDGWSRRAIELALEIGAATIVYESNYGGDLVETVMKQTMKRMGVTLRLVDVWASKSKPARFEPIAGMYERGEISHVGSFPELEDEVTQFTPNTYEGVGSPNRADAEVYALMELFPSQQGIGWDRVIELSEGASA